MRCGRFTLDLSHTNLMGVLNSTPDSFSDGGAWLDPARALAHARQMIDDGADIIDIGAESTRPGAREVPADEMPVGESLKDTIARVLPYWDSNIAPELRQGKNVLIAAHGNSLRALIKYLMNISDEKILELNLPTGTPLIFDLDDKLNIVSAPELF